MTGIDVRVSRIAIASSVCVLIGVVFFLPSLIAQLDPRVLHPHSPKVQITESGTLLLTGFAFLLGFAAMSEVVTSGGRRTGYPFAMLGVAAPFFFALGLFYIPTFGLFKSLAFHMSCGTNLSGIGKAMLIYANDYADALPLAGGRGTVWGPRLKNWTAVNRADAFGLDPDGTGGQATISSNLYLLVKYGEVAPKMFVCKGERGTRPFDPHAFSAGHADLTSLWDFGPNPVRHCSYSYHMSFGPFKLTTSNEPGLPVAADHNPWMDGARWKASNFSKFQWNGSTKQQRAGNAVAHYLDGQNALFLDSHVEFAKRAFCGLDDDNVYTISTSQTSGDPMGIPPKFGRQPANQRDSLLVNDPIIVPRR